MEKVDVNRLSNLENMRANIRHMQHHTPDLLRKGMNHLTKRMRMCKDGSHIQRYHIHLKSIIFKEKLQSLLFHIYLA